MKKKSFYLILIILLLLTLIGCESDVITSDSSHSSSSSVDSSQKKYYGINQDVFVTNSSGEYRLRITGIKETKERNEFSDKLANKVVVISYEYENISMTSDLSIFEWNFKVYDSDSNILETYPVDTKYSASVGTGRKATASMAYALNNKNNYIELEFYDNMFNSSSDCIFKLEW